MDDNIRALIQALHSGPHQVALVLAGGGSGAAAQLVAVPGASRTVLETVVPYQESVFCEYLGYRPEHFCSEEIAAGLAERALDRARHLSTGKPVLGVSCTASLATDRRKRGDHRFFIGIASEQATTVTGATLSKGARDREAEEVVVGAVLLNELARVMGTPGRVLAHLRVGERLHTKSWPARNLLLPLLDGQAKYICVHADGRIHTPPDRPRLLLPGAFNPLHEGHIKLAEKAAALIGMQPGFEMSILNVDKPPLAVEEIRRRASQFHWLEPLWLTRAPLFTDKADLFPGAIFVIGIDTAARIIDVKYYGGSPAQLIAALQHIRNQRCGFLVAGRKEPSGKFQQLSDLTLPASFEDLFMPIPETEFRFDLSSTELRKQDEEPGVRGQASGVRKDRPLTPGS